jgi:hypothetical protein
LERLDVNESLTKIISDYDNNLGPPVNVDHKVNFYMYVACRLPKETPPGRYLLLLVDCTCRTGSNNWIHSNIIPIKHWSRCYVIRHRSKLKSVYISRYSDDSGSCNLLPTQVRSWGNRPASTNHTVDEEPKDGNGIGAQLTKEAGACDLGSAGDPDARLFNVNALSTTPSCECYAAHRCTGFGGCIRDGAPDG